jgi:hypothetical protein
MAAQAQDARAEAERLESVSAEQRKDTVEARTGVEDALRKADRIDPDVRDRRTDDPSARRASDDPGARRASDDPGARRASDDPSARRATDDDTSARRATNEVSDDEAVEDRPVRTEEAKSSRADVSDNSVRDDVRRNDDGGERGVVDDRSTPRR